jgi:hypothetical protein
MGVDAIDQTICPSVLGMTKLYITYVFQYYHLNIKILKFYENWNIWKFLKILKSYENFEFFWNFSIEASIVFSLLETIARQTIELTFEPFFQWTTNFKISKISKYFKISKIFKKFQKLLTKSYRNVVRCITPQKNPANI